MNSFPKKPTDPIELADWMEINALIAPDGDFSREDSDSAIRTAALYPPAEEDREVEALMLDVFREIDFRASAAKEAYPFEVRYPVIKCKDNWKNMPAYVFCLCLSVFGEKTKIKGSYPRRWFEHISRDAVRNYIGGEAIRLASPRHPQEIPSNFAKAVQFLCIEKLFEGGGYKNGGRSSRKDDAVDIVAWKHFPDRSCGKLVIFGNCATGVDWHDTKLTELTSGPFCEEWMSEMPPSRILSSIFIPYRCESMIFKASARRAGIIFDRCRIAYSCHCISSSHREEYTNYSDILDWSLKMLDKI